MSKKPYPYEKTGIELETLLLREFKIKTIESFCSYVLCLNGILSKEDNDILFGVVTGFMEILEDYFGYSKKELETICDDFMAKNEEKLPDYVELFRDNPRAVCVMISVLEGWNRE